MTTAMNQPFEPARGDFFNGLLERRDADPTAEDRFNGCGAVADLAAGFGNRQKFEADRVGLIGEIRALRRGAVNRRRLTLR